MNVGTEAMPRGRTNPLRFAEGFLKVASSLLVLAMGCATLPPRNRAAMGDIHFRVRDFKLPSGLRIVVEEDHSAPVVAVVNLVGVGAADDPAGKEGLAHLVEHLAFRSRPDGKFSVWDMLHYSGAAKVNASTIFDATLYHELAPRESLPALLRIEANRLSQPVVEIDPKVFDVEREVVRNELRQRSETDRFGQVLGHIQQAIFPGPHRYARPVAGTHESLLAITSDDVQQFIHRHYRLDNATLVISGDIDASQIDKVLTENLPPAFFTSPPVGKPDFKSRLPAVAAEPPPPADPKWVKLQAGVSTPELAIAWSLPRGFDEHSALQDIVTGYARYVMNEASSHDDDIVHVSLTLMPGVEASMLFCTVKLNAGVHPEHSAEVVLDQVYKIWGSSAGGSKVKLKSRSADVVSLAFAAENLEERAMMRALSTHYSGDAASFTHAISSADHTTTTQLDEYAMKYLSRDRARIVYVEPLPASAVAEFGATGLGSSGAADTATVQVHYPIEAIRKISRGPGLGEARSFKTPHGLQVVVVPRRTLPLVSVVLALPSVPPLGTKPGVDRVAQDVGAPKANWNSMMFGFGGQKGMRFLADAVLLTAQAANGNLANLLASLGEEVTSMEVETEVLLDFRRKHLPFLERAEKEPKARADQAFRKELYEKHPYGESASAAQMGEVGESDAEAWLDRVYQPGQAVMAIVGDVDVVEAEKLVQSYLGNWQGHAEKLPPPPAAAATERPPLVSVLHRPGASQVEVKIGCLLPPADGDGAVANRLLAAWISGKIQQTLREKLGATYGFHGQAQALWGGSANLQLGGAIANAQLPKAFAVIQSVFSSRSEASLTDSALASTRWSIAREYNTDFLTQGELASSLALSVMRGNPIDSLDSVALRIPNVSTALVRTAFKTCLDHQTMAVVGDEQTVKRALESVPTQTPSNSRTER